MPPGDGPITPGTSSDLQFILSNVGPAALVASVTDSGAPPENGLTDEELAAALAQFLIGDGEVIAPGSEFYGAAANPTSSVPEPSLLILLGSGLLGLAAARVCKSYLGK